ncbi:helix-turn-helix domain-containing protein [Solibacillus sp. A46]|uniref:Helix-turn-helix domain-containing protein n=1 Tax=Solibacillus faecavium TaxID=2762221 RepID=A0ABR8Y1F6_9BACL|nr:helix-turn-helix domain-containing protein [Solibacillus faecavium]MBD8038014.1 helix-turn-helix domain-containing protein [Solibacillus faecavium]
MSDGQETILRQLTLSNKQLSILVESIRTITSKLQIDEVLHTIMRYALNVVPEADAGYLMLFDNHKQCLIPKTYIHFPPSIEQFQTKPNEAITGRVFATGMGEFFNSNEEIMAAMYHQNVSPHNLRTILKSEHVPQAALCVPITVDVKPIGVMIIHQLQKKRDLTQEDLLFFQAFADQVGVAIQKAQYYEKMIEKVKEAHELSLALETKHTLLKQRYDVHASLNQLLLQNEPISVILKELQKLTQLPIGFYDASDDVFLEDSFSIPYHTKSKIKKQLFLKLKPFEYRLKNKRSYIIYPLYNLDICLGSMIIEQKGSISYKDQQTLEQGANILILQILRNKNVQELHNKRIHETFQQFIDAPNQKSVASTAYHLDLDVQDYYRLCIFEFQQKANMLSIEQSLKQFISLLKEQFSSERTLIFYEKNKITFLIGSPLSATLTSLNETLQLLQRKWQIQHKPLFRSAISKQHKSLYNITAFYEEALQTLRFLRVRDEWTVTSYEKIGLNQLILQVPPRDLANFIQDQIGELLAQANKNHLYETLLAYFKFNRSIQQTAQHLHIHANTLYQRLNRIEQILNISLQKQEDTLKIQLSCYLQENYLTHRKKVTQWNEEEEYF